MVLHLNKQHKLFVLLAVLFLSSATPLMAQGYYPQENMAAAPNALTFEQFISQPGVVKHEAYFNIYQKNDRFCLEIPFSALDKDILVNAQVISYNSSFISPSSDVVRFKKHNDNTLYMYRNRSLDVQADSADVPMTDAIRNSMMLPIDKAFTIMTLGENNDSYIVDITGDISQASGLFDVSKFSGLSHPDPSRSGLIGIHGINNGVASDIYRSQTDNSPLGSMDNMQDVSNTYQLEFILQLLPERKPSMVAESPVFGFETISRQEFNMSNYGARRVNYICKWNFDTQVTVYIDPATPTVFQQSVRNAIRQWQDALSKAGVKQPFVITSDEKEKSLSYHHLLFIWGNAAMEPNHGKIIDPTTGEILAARLNFTDQSISETYMPTYYIQCRHIDKRVAKDLENLEVRSEILTVQLAAEIGKVLGMKPNWRGTTAYTSTQLCTPSWLQTHGMSASVTAPLTFNYLPTAQQGVKVSQLMPRVSDYDIAAMKFAYGKGKNVLTDRKQFYSAEDKMDPLASKYVLASDILKASDLAIQNTQQSYARLHSDFAKLPKDQNSLNQESRIAVQHLTRVEQYLTQIASLVGGRSKYPIIRKLSEKSTVYVPRDQQVAALDYLEKHILSGVPQWLLRPEITAFCSGNMSSMSIGTANGILKKLMGAEVLQSLADQERALEKDAFTAKELTDYINRVVFADFDKTQPVSDFKRKLQISLLLNVAEYVAQHNIVLGMQNEGNCLLQVWLVDTAKKIAALAENHHDKDSREHFSLLKMRLDKMYFNKNIQ